MSCVSVLPPPGDDVASHADALEGRQLTMRGHDEGAHAFLSAVIHSLYYRLWLWGWICVHLALTFVESTPPEVAGMGGTVCACVCVLPWLGYVSC
jgi:hypothetical protein